MVNLSFPPNFVMFKQHTSHVACFHMARPVPLLLRFSKALKIFKNELNSQGEISAVSIHSNSPFRTETFFVYCTVTTPYEVS